MIRPAELAAIKAGRIDLAFRRWDRPRVKPGTRLRTAVGVVEVLAVERVAASSLRVADARRAGLPTLAGLREALAHRPGMPIYRVELRWGGADPRAELRDQIPDADEIARLRAGLDRLDAASSIGPWTRPTLAIIDRSPGVRAPDLAAELGRETADFKVDVRKLKERGLTESLDIGYRLSPRGAAVLDGSPRAGYAPEPGLPRVGAGAARALRAHGLTTLDQVAELSEAELLALPGVGPFAVQRIRDALADTGRQAR